MKKPGKKIDVKKITGLTTLGVGAFTVVILLLTGWFIVKSLGDVAVAKTGDNNKTLKIQGVNNQLLDKVQKFIVDKSNPDRKVGSDIRNPFEKPAPAPPPAAPAAPPAAPAAGTTAQPAPAPAPTPTPGP